MAIDLDREPTSATGHRLTFAHRVLESVFGYSAFRHHQRRAVLAALSGRDCLAMLPTGGGKSLCYQIPAIVLPGLTIVVSPLISLMQDQVGALRRRGVAAAYLGRVQDASQQRMVWNAVRRGRVKLLYVAPERLAQVGRRLVGRTVSLLAVDEAHCISEWGHDFRPTYRRLAYHRATLGNPPTMAVTATATPDTRVDIVRVLRLERPVEVTSSFDRPNLTFHVRRSATDFGRIQDVARRLRGLVGSAIIYVPTRERADGVATLLTQWGIQAAPYHAALPPDARRRLLRQFLTGRLRVVAATNAFGMGIDKADVRVVAHLGIPPRPEAYFQEAGRAGRDGERSDCILLWTDKDLPLARFLSRDGDGNAAAAKRLGLETMRRYVLTRSCRRQVLLGYLGERSDAPCHGCDRCQIGRV